MNTSHSTLLSIAVAMVTACHPSPTPSSPDETVEHDGQDTVLQLDTFNPGTESMFAVSSTIVTGPTEAVLIDAQFQRNDARTVVERIQRSGKTLTTIYISHGDPDFYFGLDVVLDAYPDARVVASPATVAHIEATLKKKLDHWGPLLGENAPTRTVVPEVLAGDRLQVDGIPLDVIGLDGHDPKHTFVWIPSLRTVVGGVAVFENLHVWMADAQTAESRNDWVRTLDAMLALKPAKVVPGHFVGESANDISSVAFTRAYVEQFGEATAKAQNSGEIIETMQRTYPSFGNVENLELSAKVCAGEVPWP